MEKLPSWQTRAPETFTFVNGGGLQRLPLEVTCHLAHPGAPCPRVVAFQDPCRVAFETYGLSLFGGREQAARHLPSSLIIVSFSACVAVINKDEINWDEILP